MTFVGIYPNKGEIAICDESNKKSETAHILKISSNDIAKVEAMFEEIASKCGKNIGSACICLDPDYGNKIRNTFIKTALNYGFEHVEIIDWRTAVYLNAISQSNYKFKNNDIIWIFTGYSYHVWQYKNQKVKHIFSPKGYNSKIDDFKHIKVKSKLAKDPNLILLKDSIEFDENFQIDSIFPNAQKQYFKEDSYAEGALVKAQILAKQNFHNYDVNPIFDQWITVKLEKIQLFNLKSHEILPFTKSIVIKKQVSEKSLKVINHGIVDINPDIDIYSFPPGDEISIKLSFDVNGIYSVDLLPLNLNNQKKVYENGITHFVGVDFINSEVAIFDASTKQTSKQYLNKTSINSRNNENAFLELIKVTPFLSQTYTVFHVDDECYNHVLVEYYEACRKYNIKSFSFISSQTAELLNILNEHPIEDENIKTIAFISDKNAKRKNYAQIWKRDGNSWKAEKSYIRAADPGADDKNLHILKEDSNNLEGVDLVFIDSLIDEKVFKAYFNSNYKIARNEFSFAEAALQKAKNLMAKKSANFLNVENNLNRRISVMVNNNLQKCNFVMGHQLPFQQEISFENENCESYKICERNANGTKHETEYHAPSKGHWTLTLHCNIHGIFSTSYRLSGTTHKMQQTTFSKPLRQRITSLKAMSKFDFKTPTKTFTIPMLHNVSNDSITAVGIDLGTSRCCAAVNRKNGITTVPLDNKGERLLPSYVAYDEDNVKCGQIVVDRLKYFEKSSIYDSKRIIGRKIDEIENFEWPFTVTTRKDSSAGEDEEENDDALIQTEADNKEVIKFPEEVAAALLSHTKAKIEEYQGKHLFEAVITIPATFKEPQINATLAAAKLAGWEIVHFLPEPIAAAFAYFIDRPIPNNFNVLLFDLGGGTLDVCIFKVENDQILILSKHGNSKLGGRDFDDLLVDYFNSKLKSIYGINEFRNSNKGKKNYKLMLECQRIKESLSVSFTEQLDIAEFDSSLDGFITITRDTFEYLAQGLLKIIKETIKTALNTLKNDEIHKVLLVGGGCRMPMIKQLLKDTFKKADHSCEEHPDEVVAIGAAYYSYYLNLKRNSENSKLSSQGRALLLR